MHDQSLTLAQPGGATSTQYGMFYSEIKIKYPKYMYPKYVWTKAPDKILFNWKKKMLYHMALSLGCNKINKQLRQHWKN